MLLLPSMILYLYSLVRIELPFGKLCSLPLDYYISILKVESMLATTGAHSMGSPFTHVVSIYRSKIYYTLVYFGNYVKKEQAQQYGQKTIEFLQLALKEKQN
jgi:hypothetical protein